MPQFSILPACRSGYSRCGLQVKLFVTDWFRHDSRYTERRGGIGSVDGSLSMCKKGLTNTGFFLGGEALLRSRQI